MDKRKRFSMSPAVKQGITDVIQVVKDNQGKFRPSIIPINKIERDPKNARKLSLSIEELLRGNNFTEPNLEKKNREYNELIELAESIKKSGLINPIVVYKNQDKYRIIAGERRYLASLYLNNSQIDARIFDELPRETDLKLIQWFENIARVDLTLAERLINLREIVSAYLKENSNQVLNADLLSKLVGISRTQAIAYLALFQPPKDLERALMDGLINSLDKAYTISKIVDENKREEAIIACVEGTSLKKLRDFTTMRPAELKPRDRRGRIASKVNLGTTNHTLVIRKIIACVIEHPSFEVYAPHFKEVDWENYDDVSQAFKNLVKLLEQFSKKRR